jgi:hypothetical protein
VPVAKASVQTSDAAIFKSSHAIATSSRYTANPSNKKPRQVARAYEGFWFATCRYSELIMIFCTVRFYDGLRQQFETLWRPKKDGAAMRSPPPSKIPQRALLQLPPICAPLGPVEARTERR